MLSFLQLHTKILPQVGVTFSTRSSSYAASTRGNNFFMNQELIGNKFGRLTILEFVERRQYKDIVKCECECGKMGNFYLAHLLNGRTKSCGCLKNEQNHKKRPPKENIVGQSFNRLTVLKYFGYKRKQHSWECICECGNTAVVTYCDLKSGHTKSCGCLQIESVKRISTTHNKSDSPEYNAWNNMKSRCYNIKNIYYYNYGGRGIVVCERWLGENGFANFFADMGKRPTDKHSLDRFPNNTDGIYELSNCRWATIEQQNSNKRTNVFIEYDGERMTVTQWTNHLGCGKSFIDYWLSKGKSFEFIVNHYKNINDAKKS